MPLTRTGRLIPICISRFFFNLRAVDRVPTPASYSAFSAISTTVLGDIGAQLRATRELSAHSSEDTVTPELDCAPARPAADAELEMTKLPAAGAPREGGAEPDIR